MKKSEETLLISRLSDLLNFCDALKGKHQDGIKSLRELQGKLKLKKETFDGDSQDELVELTKNDVLEMRNINLDNNLLYESIKNSSAKISELYNVLTLLESDFNGIEDKKDIFKSIQQDTKDIYSMTSEGLGELDEEIKKAIDKPLKEEGYLENLTRKTLEQVK